MVYPSMTDRKRRPATLGGTERSLGRPGLLPGRTLRETPMLRRGLAASDGRGGRHGPPQPCLYRLVHPGEERGSMSTRGEPLQTGPDINGQRVESAGTGSARWRRPDGRWSLTGERAPIDRPSHFSGAGRRRPAPAPGRRTWTEAGSGTPNTDRSGLPAPGHRTEEPAPGRRTGSRPAPALGAGLGRSFVARSVVASRRGPSGVSRRSGTGSSRSSRRAGPSVA